MEKKTIVILSLISATLSLIYILLQYYGFTRYAGLHIFNTEKYVKHYTKLDKIGKHRTIISMTATPEQMKKLTPTVKSLLDQTVRVDLISVTIPYGNNYKLPSELKNAVSIFRWTNDCVLPTILPTIIREKDSTTHIITLGVDKIYGKDFIEELLEESEKNPDKIIYENNIDTIDLDKGVVFRTEFFGKDFMDVPDGIDSNIDANKLINKYFKDFPKKRIKYRENYRRF
jgi:hypothetical protein